MNLVGNAYSEPCQTFKTEYSKTYQTSQREFFAKLVHGFQPLTMFAKKLHLVCLTGFWISLWVENFWMVLEIIHYSDLLKKLCEWAMLLTASYLKCCVFPKVECPATELYKIYFSHFSSLDYSDLYTHNRKASLHDGYGMWKFSSKNKECLTSLSKQREFIKIQSEQNSKYNLQWCIYDPIKHV